ncbi:acyltransferase family protein [Sphingomonas sp. BE138]|uniref:acyltransferase family protein n=1 Tax=Sphingomonas sp. BE138 TaxID=2817845 RepID=UPI00286C655E|nr:acyltransferase family protein [Sphingomonas sp. BE138]
MNEQTVGAAPPSTTAGATPAGRPPVARGHYRPDIDGLRALAVLMVMAFHFTLTPALGAGFIGVDMFFVLSGFLIVPAIRSDLSTGRFRFRTFYARRVRRLAPALLATSVATLGVGLVLLTPVELKELGKELLAAQLYASNIYYWRYLNYFGLQADLAFFLHAWSLGVEEQFYLVFPALLWIAARVAPRRVTSLLVAALLASFLLNIGMMHRKPEATFYLLPTRVWEFAAGALVPGIAAWCAGRRIPSWMFAAIGVATLAVALAIHQPTMIFPGWFAILPVVATMALLIAGTDTSGLWTRAASRPVPVYVGRISYELYLVHWPVHILAPLLVLDMTLAARVAAFALCFPLAALIYHVVEAPVRGRRVLARDRALIAVYAATTLAMVAALTATIASGGWPARLTPAARTLAAASDDADASFRACENRAGAPCPIGAAAAPATWLVYGDSHADAIAPAMQAVLRARGQSGYFTFRSGCLPLRNSGDAGCRAFNAGVAAFLAQHPGVTRVMMVSTWRQALEPGYTDPDGAVVTGAAAIAAHDRMFDRTVAANGANGRLVYLWLPVPGARRSVPLTLSRDAMLHRQWPLAYSLAEHRARFAFLTAALARHPGVLAIDPAAAICRGGTCRIMEGGRPLYHDDAHLAGSQRAFIERMITDQIGDR